MFPVTLDFTGVSTSNLDNCLKVVKEQLRSIPKHGIGYGLLKYFTGSKFGTLKDEIDERSERLEQIYFNFLGKFDSLFKSPELETLDNTDATIGESCEGPETVSTALIELNAVIGSDKCLSCEWKFVSDLFSSQEIEKLSSRFLQVLETFTTFLEKDSGVGGYTPSDFPLVPSLTQHELDDLVGSQKDIVDVYPLTPMQEGMLFHTLKEPHDQLYITQIVWPMTIPSVASFKQAWGKLVERHSILRTAFVWERLERPLQVVHKPYNIDSVWTDLDYSAIESKEVADQTLSEFCEQDRIRGFDLSLPHLVRLALVKLKDSDIDSKYYFVFTHHHLYLDGWSVSNLISELQRLYDSPETATVPEVSQFREYVAALQERDLEESKKFWVGELKNFSAPLPLPRPVYRLSTERNSIAKRKDFILKSELVKKMAKYEKVHQLTLNTLVQAVWALILNGLTREKAVTFGSVYSGRSFVDGSIPSIGNMVGMFINTLPICINVDPEQSLLDFLRYVQQKSVNVNEHEDTPLLVVKSCANLAGSEFFNSIVVVENYPGSTGPGDTEDAKLLIHEEGRLDYERTNFPLTWAISVQGDCGCGFTCVSLTALYDAAQVDSCVLERMAALWSTLLEQVVTAEVQLPIKKLNLVSEGDQTSLTHFNKDTQEFFEPTDLIHGKFEEQAERRPDALAIYDLDEQVSYGELNRRMNKLARFLSSIGVQSESVVAVDMDRCVDLYVCIYAVLKLGATYLAIGQNLPEERKSFLLSDSGACVLLVRGTESSRDIAIDVSRLDLSAYSGENLNLPVHPLNQAYLIYSSGTTGTSSTLI